MSSPFMGEFAGTLVLILLGDGVVANVLLKRSKAEGAGWMVITTAWGFAVLCGIFTAIAFGSADAHINPAVTLAFAITSGNYAKIVPYWSAQFLGAFTGATLVWLYFLPHWRMTEDKDAKLAVFCTAPAIRHYPGNLFCEVIGTMLLIIVVAAIGSKAVAPDGTDDRAGTVFHLYFGMGDWIVAGRNNRLRDQSRARFWAARSARVMAGGREGKLRLGVCTDTNSGTAARRCAGGGDRESRAHHLASGLERPRVKASS